MSEETNKILEFIQVTRLRLEEIDELVLPILRELKIKPVIRETDKSLTIVEEESSIEEEEIDFRLYLKTFEKYLEDLNKEWFLDDTEIYQKTKEFILLFKQILYYFEKRDFVYSHLLERIKEKLVEEEEKEKKPIEFFRDRDFEEKMAGFVRKYIEEIKKGNKKLHSSTFNPLISGYTKKGYPEPLIVEFKKKIDDKLKIAGLNPVWFFEEQEKKDESAAPWE